MEEKIIAAVVVSAVAFFSVYALTPIFIKVLERQNLVVQDVNKKGSVMVAAAYVKTNETSEAINWSSPPAHLERTTAECLWPGLARATPYGPWSTLPSVSLTVWL